MKNKGKIDLRAIRAIFPYADGRETYRTKSYKNLNPYNYKFYTKINSSNNSISLYTTIRVCFYWFFRGAMGKPSRAIFSKNAEFYGFTFNYFYSKETAIIGFRHV